VCLKRLQATKVELSVIVSGGEAVANG